LPFTFAIPSEVIAPYVSAISYETKDGDKVFRRGVHREA
jgi:hypothetical protein